ncbi:phosphate signaling complex protein PhoU [Roseibacillus persicicus]|uniref:Phosphate-specific transport system accessory protein PhoU n=1 Tax=Roseibacillus persicicus TaxID=454148 RepID=A0A918TUQ0_9BACT|nr:phosphate signaling complex protein PhoU [Roseibacillus persicicus]MDQ8192248.1 phosphate signaling complex protein PhoU [Roseibacillus persicicus]GHC64217.1 phosphate transport system regulatory protein PhoU [Roseibacillus persicicus]
MPGKHILASFDEALTGLKEDVLELGVLCRSNLSISINALLKRELDQVAQVLSVQDDMISLATRIDEDAMNLIVRFQPVASDLRFVLHSMKVAANLDRIASHVVKIAKRTPKILAIAEVVEVNLLEPLYLRADQALGQSIVAYSDNNPEAVSELSEEDNEIDKLYKKARKTYTSAIEDSPEHYKELIHLMFVARSLERIGDHAVHIAEILVD